MEIGEFVEAVKEIDFNDIIKLQIINCLQASTGDVMTLINAVAVLEQLLLKEISGSDYFETVADVEEEIAKKFPRFKTDNEQYQMYQLELAKRKLGMLVHLVKSRMPETIISSEVGDTEESSEEGEEK